MLIISEPKLAGLVPRWAPFPGFSLLFDNPGRSRRREGEVEVAACDVTHDEELGFYRRLYEGFERMRPDRLLQAYGLCPLPPASYHVTAFDTANVGDLRSVHAEKLDELRELLDGVPRREWSADHPLLTPSLASPLVQDEWRLRFAYDRLGGMGGNGIVVRLRPLDEAEFERFVAARRTLSRNMRAPFGVGAGEGYGPHVSLAYFANSAGSELAAPRYEQWDAILRENVGDEVLEFRSVSLYAFSDMGTFFRKPKPEASL